MPRRPLGVKVHVWEPGDINQKEGIGCPRRVEFAKASAIACGLQEVKGWSLTA